MKIKNSIKCYDNGNIECEWWHKENDTLYRHKEDGPAYTVYYKDGELLYEEWWMNNNKHRIDGPAIKEYNKHGTVSREFYFIKSNHVNSRYFNAEMKVIVIWRE